MGKSYNAVVLIKRIQQNHPAATTHITVPTLYLQGQFQQAIHRAGLRNVEVFCINTYVRQQRVCDFLLLDEVHLFLSEHAREFGRVFSICTARWKLGLSATLTAEEKQRLIELGLPVIDVITMREALTQGWISPHVTINCPIELTFAEREEYNKWHDIHNNYFAKLGHDFGHAMLLMTNKGARELFAQQMGWRAELGAKHMWSPQSIGKYANTWNLASRNRRDVVNHASQKYQAALYLIDKFPVKCICFSESTRFATELHRYIPEISRVYHTQLESEVRTYTVTKSFKTKPDVVLEKSKRIGPATLKKEAIEAFNDPDSPVRAMLTAKALDQGADFAHLNMGIETSGTGTIRQKVQRTGRVVRKDTERPIEEQMAIFVHLFAADTYESAKLRRKQKGLTGVVEVKRVQDIEFGFPTQRQRTLTL